MSTIKAAIATLTLAGALALAGCAANDSDGTDGPDTAGTEDLAEAGSNGIEDLEATEILDQVTEAVDGATSVHLVGEQTHAGSAIGLDLRMSGDGDAAGSVTNAGVTIELILADGTTYFSAGEDFWAGQLGPELAAEVGDKFVEVPASDDSFGDFGNFDVFFSDLLKPEGDVGKGDESTVEGVPALILVDTDDDGELYVSMQGEPLPLKVSSQQDESEMVFLDWNEEVVVDAPADADVVDLESLVPDVDG
jgi:hypothetical protein